MQTSNVNGKNAKNRKTAVFLSLIVVFMFGFGFALVPLYKLVCEVTGIGISGSAGSGRVVDEGQWTEDKNRWVTVEFDTTLNQQLQWDFSPAIRKLKVRPGKAYEVSYYAKNNTDKTIIAQAVPGITPWQASNYFNKTECFCFTQQTLEAGEKRDMPLRFIVDPALPQDIKILTLSYTIMDTDRNSIRSVSKLEPAVSGIPRMVQD